MPKAIRQNDTVRPKQDSMVIAMNERSAAIEEMVFMVSPLLLALTGLEGAVHRTKNFMIDCPISLIESQRDW